jgi:diguanylate cyclase (GGDEF)-like protein
LSIRKLRVFGIAFVRPFRQGLPVARTGGNGTDGEPREDTAAGRLAREVSALQAQLLDKLRLEMPPDDVDAFAAAAKRLAEAFGTVTAAAVDPVAGSVADAGRPAAPAPPEFPLPETHPSLYRHGHMRRRLDQLLEMHRRYDQPFCLAVFDVAGPATRNGHGGVDAALTVVGAALRDSVRLVDEPFRLEEDALCVLAPNQDTVGGVQMSERLLRTLAELEAAGGLPIEISAGVVACPDHGTEADALLHNADEAMWRARSVGQPVGVGRLQDR